MSNKQTVILYSDLLEKLNRITLEQASPLKRAELSIPICETALQELYHIFKPVFILCVLKLFWDKKR
jgi:hypothetical protein